MNNAILKCLCIFFQFKNQLQKSYKDCWHCAINVTVVSWNLVWHLAQVLSVSQTASIFIYEATSEQWTSLQGCCSCCHWPQSSKCLQSRLMSTCSHVWSCTTVCWLTSLGISVSDWYWREGRNFLSVNVPSDLRHDKLTVWLVPFPYPWWPPSWAVLLSVHLVYSLNGTWPPMHP